MADFVSMDAFRPMLTSLLGAENAQRQLNHWLEARLAKVADRAFSERFNALFSQFPVRPVDFAHRLVSVGGCQLLAGIRFYGGDPERPFVELMAWTEGFNLAAVCDAIRSEWHYFAPFALRMIACGGTGWPCGYVDQGIHAARVDSMPSPAGTVALVHDVDTDLALALVRDKYEALLSAEPELAAELYPTDRADLSECRARGTLSGIAIEDRIVGLIATLPGEIEFLPGQIVVEEIVCAPFNGRGIAAEAQRQLAAELREANPDTVIAGTIQRSNLSSRLSAERAGRPAVFRYIFIDL